MNEKAKQIASAISASGGKCYAVGGYVRDKLLQLETKDFDFEVFNLPPDKLAQILSSFGKVCMVGKSFGVYKVKGINADFSIPRKERKTGMSHRDFTITADPYMKPEEAILRRDFTANALMLDVITNKLLDFCDGERDILNRRLRHVSPTAFMEDPLRIFRGIRLAGKLNFQLNKETKQMMQSHLTTLNFLPKERVYEEIKAILLESEKPSISFSLMREIGIVDFVFPELNALIGCPQSPISHPEGDVWQHTLMTLDEAAKLRHLSSYPETLMWSALCHDLGKAVSTTIEGGTIKCHGHHNTGKELSKTFMARLTEEKSLIDAVATMTQEHMTPYFLFRDKAKESAIKRLALRVNLSELLLLAEADARGRATDYGRDVLIFREWFMGKTQKVTPLVKGRHLIERGFVPGPAFGHILKNAFEQQLEGASFEEIIKNIDALQQNLPTIKGSQT